jgi:hypothetical protein
MALGIGTSILGGVQTGLNVAGQLGQYKNSGKSGGSVDYSSVFKSK